MAVTRQRGNDKNLKQIVPHALRGNSSRDAPRLVTQSVTNGIPTLERGNDKNLKQIVLLQRRDACQCYQNWLRAMQRMAVRSSARRVGFTDWQAIDMKVFDDWVKQLLNESWLPVEMQLKGYLLSSVLQYLGDLGFDAQCDFLGDGQFNLADDLAKLLWWDFYPVLLVWCQRSSQVPEQVLIVKFYQQRCQRIEHLM